MSVVPVALLASDAEDLEFRLNTALAPLTHDAIFGVEIDQTDRTNNASYFSRTMYAAFSYDSAGAAPLLSPFQAKVIASSTDAQAILLIKQFIAANPTYFFSQVFVTFSPRNPNPDQAVIAVIFYNVDGAAAEINWRGGAGGSPVGPVGGDLSGTLPNPTVVGIQNTPVAAGPFPGGGQLTYDATTSSFKWYVIQVYTSLALAAAAQANQIVGQSIIVYTNPTTPANGTYTLTVKTGNITDYTKISDVTDVASEVALDAPISPLLASNVFQALQEIVAATINPQFSGTVLPSSVTTIATVPIASVADVDWQVVLQIGSVRYIEKLHYTHDGVNPFGTSDGIAGTALPFPATLSVTLSGGNLNLVCTNTSLSGCDFRVKAVTLPI